MYYFIFQQKSLQTSKRNPRVIKHDKATHRNTVFFIQWTCPFLICNYRKSRCSVRYKTHQFIGSASKASGSLMIMICKFLTSINVSCLHLGQKRGYFFNSVSSRILVRVLPPHIGHNIHFSFFIILFFSHIKLSEIMKRIFYYFSYNTRFI